jgi:hypothetical protein
VRWRALGRCGCAGAVWCGSPAAGWATSTEPWCRHLLTRSHLTSAQVPYDFGPLADAARGGDVINTNHKRVVETWMDEQHKEYFYTRIPLARLPSPP